MSKVFRHDMKLRTVGNSTGMTIPVRTRYLWNAEVGEQLTTYQIDDLLVVIPQRYLLEKGLHPKLNQLLQTLGVSDL